MFERVKSAAETPYVESRRNPVRELIPRFKSKLGLLVFALMIAGFLSVVGQRLAEVPVPQVDESYMLQTSYEMLTRGKLALPFRRYIGGNIENDWHSLTPVHYVIQTGFFKVFGWGIAQGRAFNLSLVIISLLLIYLIARKLFDAKAGLIGIALLMCDVTFIERSRFLRNDYSAVMFSLLAFFLYEAAERRRDRRLFAAAGLSAGAAVMCHTASLYILAAIFLLMLFRRSWRIIKDSRFYLFAMSALLVAAYEIVSDLIDLQNFRMQYHGDKRHFKLLDTMGWLRNLNHESIRYRRWYAGESLFADVPHTLAHAFQYLTLIAIVYLIVRVALRIRRRGLIDEARFRLLIVTITVVAFFAVITSQKAVYYMTQLTPWFALAVGVMFSDGLHALGRLKDAKWTQSSLPKVAYSFCLAGVLIVAGTFGYQALKLGKRYLRSMRNPEVARFDEFKTAIRSVVPSNVCPVEVGDPVMWLAFPEHHLCFAYIEERMEQDVDTDGNEYAVIVDPKIANYWLKSIASTHNHLIGELYNTSYGDFQVYYTGTDPRWLALDPIRYQFFGRRRGYTTETQVTGAQQVWSASAMELSGFGQSSDAAAGSALGQRTQQPSSDSLTKLCTIDLKPETVYKLTLDAQGGDRWDVLALEEASGFALQRKAVRDPNQMSGESTRPAIFDGVFRTGITSRVTIAVAPRSRGDGEPLHISRISISEVPWEPLVSRD